MQRKNNLIVLTRSADNNQRIKDELDKTKVGFIDCPLLSYQEVDINPDFINKFNNVVITSKFAAQNIPPTSTLKAWVVGESSAQILKQKGYSIEYCAQNAEELKDHLLNAENEKNLYLCANHITTQMPSFVHHKVFYRVTYTNILNNEQISLFKKYPNYILLYSVNCAKTLLQLINDYNLQKYLAKTTIIALSYKISNVFKKICKNKVIRNNHESMTSYLKEKLWKKI
ncbi:MAG: hypothetical protein DGJ47_000402 [Rickettsiaceae bacterium]